VTGACFALGPLLTHDVQPSGPGPAFCMQAHGSFFFLFMLVRMSALPHAWVLFQLSLTHHYGACMPRYQRTAASKESRRLKIFFFSLFDDYYIFFPSLRITTSPFSFSN
jgi:hypothetical protein